MAVKNWTEAGWQIEDAVEWASVGWEDPYIAYQWSRFFNNPRQAKSWFDNGFSNPEEAKGWELYFDYPYDAAEWHSAGFEDPSIAKDWFDFAGLSPEEAFEQYSSGKTLNF